MTIGIFVNPVILEKTGIGRYAYNLVKEMLIQDKNNDYVLFANFFRSYDARKKALEEFAKKTGNNNIKLSITRYPDNMRDYLWGTKYSKKLFFHEKIDVYLSLFSAHIPINGFSKEVCVFHDLVFAKYPETQGKKFSHYYYKRTKNAVEKAKIVCISESTKKDLIEYFKIKDKNIEIVYPAVDHKVFNIKPKDDCLKVAQKCNITKPYILAVGTLEPRKNLETLIDSYVALPVNIQKEYQLVLAGGIGWHDKKLRQKISDLQLINSNLIITGFIDEKDLPYLYSGATAFVYPSLYEGFGIPVLEAMACGTPAITSNISSLPEVAGGAGILINPKNNIELNRSINKLLSDENLRKSLTAKGIKQAQNFTWQKSAKKMIEIINKMR